MLAALIRRAGYAFMPARSSGWVLSAHQCRPVPAAGTSASQPESDRRRGARGDATPSGLALQQVVLSSAVADVVAAQPVAERPTCPTGGGGLEPRGRQRRRIRPAQQRQSLEVDRSYTVRSECGAGPFSHLILPKLKNPSRPTKLVFLPAGQPDLLKAVGRHNLASKRKSAMQTWYLERR
jgi:hypothetical protein